MTANGADWGLCVCVMGSGSGPHIKQKFNRERVVDSGGFTYARRYSSKDTETHCTTHTYTRIHSLFHTRTHTHNTNIHTWRSMLSARKGCSFAKPAVERAPARRPMQRATLRDTYVRMYVFMCV